MKTLIFEGAGWDKADSSVLSGVGNCRIRTRLRNNDGRVIYLEMSGFIHQGKKPEFAQPFYCVGHVNHCFYSDSAWDSRRGVSSGLKSDTGHFEYNKQNILKFVNTLLNCSFDTLEVVNDGSVRVHDTSDPLCESITSGYTPYADPIVSISELQDITPLHEWPSFRMAKYQLNYDFVKSLPFIKRWLADRSERERSQFPRYRYHVIIRWNQDGTITSAEISSDQNFANFGIGLDTLRKYIASVIRTSVHSI